MILRRRYMGGEHEVDNYTKMYLTFKALGSGTFTLTIHASVSSALLSSISYSIDGGNTWTTTSNISDQKVVITTPTVNAGNEVLWKGTGAATAASTYASSVFSSTCEFEAYGNVMSLLYGDNFINVIKFAELSVRNLVGLFENNKKIKDAFNLVLPATILTKQCYYEMFRGCTILVRGPKRLPATTMAKNCYNAMFMECSALVTTPQFSCNILEEGCCHNMFYNCSNLVTIPATLPATTLKKECYCNMFYNCTSLTTAPTLPATTLANYCYEGMFYGCTNLSYIKAMFITTPSDLYTRGWLSGVAATGIFVKNSAATWNVTGTNGVPSGWTVQTAS